MNLESSDVFMMCYSICIDQEMFNRDNKYYKLTNNAKVLYGVLEQLYIKDKSLLPRDNKDTPYLSMKLSTLGMHVNLSISVTANTLRELEACELITLTRPDVVKPYRIYVKPLEKTTYQDEVMQRDKQRD